MIRFENVSYAYNEDEPSQLSLTSIDLTIETGECVVLCGASGCGKTSMTRLINGLIPHHFEGVLTGQVFIDEVNISEQPLVKTAHRVGSVFQNPRSQFFNVDTTSEIAFGCENLGMDVEEIKQRVIEVNTLFDLEKLMHRSIFELSGGEKQRIACASAYATHPKVIVLDEPSSSLDASAIEQLRSTIKLLKQAGKTVVLSEHRLYYLSDLADRYLYLKDGHLDSIYTAAEMQVLSREELAGMCLRELDIRKMICPCRVPQSPSLSKAKNEQLFSLKNVVCEYGKKRVLAIEQLSLPDRGVTAIIGKNGAGKSTFAHCLCGLQKHKGDVSLCGEITKSSQRVAKSYMVMQDVNHQLFTESVLDEVALGAKAEELENIDEILRTLNLDTHKETHPLALSGGQKQRVAIAGALCSDKQVLIYDEPTSGLDYKNMQVTCDLIKSTAKSALLSLVITHDLEFIFRCCDSVLHIENGTIIDNYHLDEEGIEKVRAYFLLT